MKTYLDNLISEKDGFDMDTVLEAEGPSGTNYIPLQILVDIILLTPKQEQDGIRSMLVKIDFRNGDVLDYFRHLAQAVAI